MAAVTAGITIAPLADAVAKLSARTPIGAALRSDQWADVPLALRERAQFSANVESLKLLQAIQNKLALRVGLLRERVANGDALVDRSSFIADIRAVAVAEGVQTAGSDAAGTVRDIRSSARLGLIFDQQTQQAAGFADWKMGQDTDVLDAFPAQELIRVEDRQVPRNWNNRWTMAGGKSYGGRMIALKSAAVWEKISRFGTPWPPFDFGSGMGVQDVGRDEAEALGLMKATDVVAAVQKNFNDCLEASSVTLPRQARDEFKRAFGDRVSVAGDSVAWVGDKGVKVGDLWDRGRADPAIDQVVQLGPPRSEVLRKVQKVLGEGRDMDGIVETIASKDFNHVWNKRGEGQDVRQGTVTISREDFLRIALVIDAPLDVVHGGQPRTVVLSRRFLDGVMYYVEAYVKPKVNWATGEQKAPPELRSKSLWKA